MILHRAATGCRRLRPLALFVLFGLVACKGGGSGGGPSTATALDPPAEPELPGDQPAFPLLEHVDQLDVLEGEFTFAQLFRIGDDFFEAQFTTLDGVGALELPDGSALPSRFSRVPPGGGRSTGPNGQACNACHNSPFGTSAGEAAANVLQDPSLTGQPPFNQRNTISLFGSGVVQRLAEELTEALQRGRDEAIAEAGATGVRVVRELAVGSVSFGSLEVVVGAGGTATVDTSAVEGVSPDLIVRPFGWKGDVPSLRAFSRQAALNELGLEAEELVFKEPDAGPDPDGDGVETELSVGDVTALVVYIAAQETPTTMGEMAARGFIAPPSGEFESSRRRGETLFSEIGCAACHIPELVLEDPVFEEPTLRGTGGYADSSEELLESGLDPAAPTSFDLALEGDVPRPEPHPGGGLRIALFGDLKRHRMGRQLADAQPTPVMRADGTLLTNEDGEVVAVPVDVFLTAELWGVGNTGPWLHDGRAATLEEAIVLHGEDAPPPPGSAERSEAQESREAFVALSDEDREAVVTFLKSLILFEMAEEE